jgi:hypothetical protein
MLDSSSVETKQLGLARRIAMLLRHPVDRVEISIWSDGERESANILLFENHDIDVVDIATLTKCATSPAVQGGEG